MKAANSAGVLPTAIAASRLQALERRRLAHRARRRGGELVGAAGAARLAGASRPYHCVISKPGQPCSATVGTSGSCAMRCADAGRDAAQLAGLDELQDRRRADRRARASRPASRSVSCGPVPRYGTCTTKVPVAIFRYSNARWPALPLPAEP